MSAVARRRGLQSLTMWRTHSAGTDGLPTALEQVHVRTRPNSFDGCRLAMQAAAAAGVMDRVAPLPIPRLQLAEAQESLAQHPERPFIVQGAMEEWEARHWDCEELKRRHGDVQVPTERSTGGGDYRDLHRPRCLSASPRSFKPDHFVPFGELLDHMQHHSDDRQATMCLAQKDLFAQIPELQAGVQLPPFPEAMERLYMRNVWLGPTGTTTPLHRDPYFNFLCQVWGSKEVSLFDSQWSQHLYPHMTPVLRNTSQVDVANPNAKAFPLFMRVPYKEATLQASEMLYIPKRCWHFVRAASPSFSVNYWWT